MEYGDVVCSPTGRRLVKRHDLWIGRHILAETLNGFQLATVQRGSDGELYWKHQATVGTLSFHEGVGWVCTGSYDTAVMAKPLVSEDS